MFKKFKTNSAKSRLLEEKLYEQVLDELKLDKRRDGLWAKALAESDGSEERAQSIYIKLRVQSIQDEAEVIDEIRYDEEQQRVIDVAKEARKNSIEEVREIFERNDSKLVDEGDYWQGINSKGGHFKKFKSSKEMQAFADKMFGYGYWS